VCYNLKEDRGVNIMICKKCGANIEENSKFCGTCGEPVSIETDVFNNQNQNNEIDLGNTIQIEPVENNVQNNTEVSTEQSIGVPVENEVSSVDVQPTIPGVNAQMGEMNTVQETLTFPVSETDVAVETNQVAGSQIIGNSQEQTIVQNQTNPNEQMAANPVGQNLPPMTSIDPTKKETKKTNKLIPVFLTIAILLIVLVGVSFVVTNKTNNPLEKLEKAFVNFTEKGKNSASVDAKLSFSLTTGESFALSATVKAQKKIDDLINMQITLNKSIMFDEINLYTEITKESAKLYAQSSLIDMIGMTSSPSPMWIYYLVELDELVIEDQTNANAQNIDLKELIGIEKFVFVEKTDDISRYQLSIDKELIEEINTKTNAGLDTETLRITEPIKIDFYVNNSDELTKIQIDMSETLKELGTISSATMSIEFSNLGNTIVEIPSDAKNSIIDLETYMTNYPLNFGFGDENLDINFE